MSREWPIRADVRANGHGDCAESQTERALIFRSILVDVDATADAQPALDRAVRIASASGARLRVVDVVPAEECASGPSEISVGENLYGRRRERLAALASGIRGVPVDWRMLAGPAAAALVDEVRRSHHDLVMRLHSRDLIVRRSAERHDVDVQLFRTCPCPVWAVGYGVPPTRPHVVAAVRVGVEDDDDDTRITRIVEVARAIAHPQASVVTLLHAWTAFGERRVGGHASREDFATYLHDTRERVERRLATALKSSDDEQPIRIVLRHGEPEQIISEYVVRHAVDIVVVGAGVTGRIARFMFEGTAERLLRKLPCSIVAVRTGQQRCPS